MTMTEVTISISVVEIGMSIAVTGLLLNMMIQSKVQALPVVRLATQLNTEVITKRELDQLEGGYQYFVHGSTTNNWLEALGIDPSKGRPDTDFGLGFYTFPLPDSRSIRKSSEWAIRTSMRSSGTPF